MKNLFKHILIVLTVGVFGCKDGFFQPEPQNNPEALFENLWQEFDQHYAPFEERNVNWDEAYTTFRPRVNAQTSDAELIAIFKEMLSTLDDSHVELTVPGQNVWKANRIVNEKIDDELFDLEMIKSEYLNNNFKVNGFDNNTYGWIGDIGYVHMRWVSDNTFVFEDILDHFADARGLIIDYRHNGGGQFMWGFDNFSRLTREKRFTHKTKTKNGPGKYDYTDWFEWYLEPAGEYFDKPIVFLTDRYTISAGERMTYAMKTLPNVTHLGDSTNGSIGTKVARELANGWKYTIVTQKVEGFDTEYYEGKGIPPDIYVKNTSEEMSQGIDRTLEMALSRF